VKEKAKRAKAKAIAKRNEEDKEGQTRAVVMRLKQDVALPLSSPLNEQGSKLIQVPS